MKQPLKLIKLSTGENIIGEVIEDTPTIVIIKHPLRAMIIPRENGLNIALLRWDFLFDFESVSFNKNSIIAFGQTSDEVHQAYNESIARYYGHEVENDVPDEEYMDELEKAFSSIKSKSIH